MPKITGKITDFGLSSILGSALRMGSSLISNALKWPAPELAAFEDDDFEQCEIYLEKADVWSSALTSLEVNGRIL
jgi:hypothetical protein